jgi:hypothetical protein
VDYFVRVRGDHGNRQQQLEYRMADRSINPHDFTGPNPA